MLLLMMGYSTFNAYRIRSVKTHVNSIPVGVMIDELERLGKNQKEILKKYNKCNYELGKMAEQIDMFVSEHGSYE